MAKNYKQRGQIIQVTAPVGGVVSGTAYVIGSIFGVALNTVDAGEEVSLDTSGIYSLPKTAGVAAYNQGVEVYWDNPNGIIEASDTATNQLVGAASSAALIGAALIDVKLNGVSLSAASGDLAAKANKVIGAVTDNVAGLTATGDLQDSLLPANEVVLQASNAAAAGTIPEYDGANKIIVDSLIESGDLATMGSAAGGADLLISSAGADKSQQATAIDSGDVVTMAVAAASGQTVIMSQGPNKEMQDSTVGIAKVNTMDSIGTLGNLVQSAGNDKSLEDAGVVGANVSTMAAAGVADNLIKSAGADKTQEDSGIKVVANGLQLGSATVDTGAITMIKGAKAGNPQVILALSADVNGDFSITPDAGQIDLNPAGTLDGENGLTVDSPIGITGAGESSSGTKLISAASAADGGNKLTHNGLEVEVEGHASDAGGRGVFGIRVNDYISNGGVPSEAVGYLSGENYDCAFVLESGDFYFDEYAVTISMYGDDDAQPPKITLKGGDGDADSGDAPGGDLDLLGGDADTAIGGNVDGGDVTISGGAKSNSGDNGFVRIVGNLTATDDDAKKAMEIIGRTGDVNHSRAEFIDEMWNGIRPEWTTRVTTGATAAQSTENGWYRLTTGAVDDNEESIDWGDICTFKNTKRPSFEIQLTMDSPTVIAVEAGLIEASGGGDDEYIKFRLDHPDVDGNWYLAVNDNTGEVTDVGAAADTSVTALRFEFTSDTALEWFISTDGGATWTSQGTVATKVPTVALQPFVSVAVRNNDGARLINVDYVKIGQDRV